MYCARTQQTKKRNVGTYFFLAMGIFRFVHKKKERKKKTGYQTRCEVCLCVCVCMCRSSLRQRCCVWSPNWEEINALPDLQCPDVVLPQEIMKEKIIEKDNRSAKRICWFCCCVEFFRERFNLKSFFRILVGFGYSGACIFIVAWKSVPDFCSLKEVCQTVHIAPHNVVIIKQCCVTCPLCDLRYENKTNKTKQMKEKEDWVFVISP